MPFKKTYIFIAFPQWQGYNVKFLAGETTSLFNWQLCQNVWTGKICRRITPHIVGQENSDVFDLNERALLAYDLATLLAVRIPHHKLVQFGRIGQREPLDAIDKKEFYPFENILLSKVVGRSLQKNDYPHININDLMTIFVFDCWLGNFDKKDDDYIIDERGGLMTIDYQLWGPVDDSGTTLGFCARLYDLTAENSIRRAVGNSMRKVLTENLDKANYETIVRRIESLPDRKIAKLVNKCTILERGSKDKRINEYMIRYLISRKKRIRQDMVNVIEILRASSNQNV